MTISRVDQLNYQDISTQLEDMKGQDGDKSSWKRTVYEVTKNQHQLHDTQKSQETSKDKGLDCKRLNSFQILRNLSFEYYRVHEPKYYIQ